MPMANIACARSIVTDRRLGVRRPGKPICYALALAALLAMPASLRAEATPKPDPSFPFSREIEAFARARDAGPALVGATLFIGSSSIRLWDIDDSFPDIATVNRGFGGATTPDVLHYYSRLLPRAQPASIVVYVGENDLAAGRTPAQVAGDILTLLRRLRSDYPRARIAFLSLKPSPIRWTLWPKMAAVNMTVAARARVAAFDYVDVGRVLLAPDGLPDASLFRPDGLHMNKSGYARWTRIVDDYLDRSSSGNAGIRAS